MTFLSFLKLKRVSLQTCIRSPQRLLYFSFNLRAGAPMDLGTF